VAAVAVVVRPQDKMQALAEQDFLLVVAVVVEEMLLEQVALLQVVTQLILDTQVGQVAQPYQQAVVVVRAF
jgi:hypothetical protein